MTWYYYAHIILLAAVLFYGMVSIRRGKLQEASHLIPVIIIILIGLSFARNWNA